MTKRVMKIISVFCVIRQGRNIYEKTAGIFSKDCFSEGKILFYLLIREGKKLIITNLVTLLTAVFFI